MVYYCIGIQCELLYDLEVEIMSRLFISQIESEPGPAAYHQMSKKSSITSSLPVIQELKGLVPYLSGRW